MAGSGLTTCGYLDDTPTVNETDTLRPDISVNTSFGDATLVAVDAGLTAVMACLLVRLFTAKRILVFESIDEPLTV